MSRWRSESAYITRYACAGGLNAVVGLGSIFVLMWIGLSPILANIIGYLLSLMLAFFTAKKFVFRSAGKVRSESIRYLIAFSLSFLCNLGMLHISLEILMLPTGVAQLIAISSYVVTMYLISRIFVFSITNIESMD